MKGRFVETYDEFDYDPQLINNELMRALYFASPPKLGPNVYTVFVALSTLVLWKPSVINS